MKKKYQFFISSTYADLIDERLEIIQTILRTENIPLGMEAFPAADKKQMDLIKEIIDQSDFYIVLVGGRYGSIDPETGKSYTELEYDYAVSRGIPILAFLKTDDSITKNQMDTERKKQLKLEAFKSKLKQKLLKFWSNKHELAAAVSQAIMHELKNSPPGGLVKYNQMPEILELTQKNEINKKYTDQLKSCIEKLNSHQSFNISGKNLLQKINNEILSCINEISICINYHRSRYIERYSNDKFRLFDTPYCHEFRRLFNNRLLNSSMISNGIFETELAYLFTVYGLYNDDVMNDLQYNKYSNDFITDLRHFFDYKDRNNINNWNLLLDNVKESTKNRTPADFGISDTIVGTFYSGDYSEILLPFFDELYKIFTSLDEEKLEEIEKKVIAEKLKEYLTIEIQCLLFFHSVSYVGRKWGVESEYNNITRKKYNLMNKFQLIDKIPKNFIANIDFYYPKITFEFEN